MKKIMILLSILLAGVLLFTGCVIKVNDDSSVFLEFSENDGLPTEINVAAGNSFAISLEANATTGYSWTAAIDDESIVTLESNEYVAEDTGLEGSGGTAILTFSALKKGQTSIVLTYVQQWEGGNTGEEKTLTVTVE